MKKNILILDLASPEFNRGSFCYLPYIYYSAMKANGHKVRFLENFVVEDMDKEDFTRYDEVVCFVWSYPQIDSAKVLDRFSPKEIKFSGYKGLIEFANLRPFVIDNETIKKGIENYFFDFKDFKNILLSDCDMHFAQYPGQVYPLFTSYGCPKSCSFCATSKNCGQKVVFADEEKIKDVFRYAAREGMLNIHFTDEDFLLNTERAHRILVEAKKCSDDFKFIAMASSSSLARYIDKYGFDKYLDLIKIAEVGFETGDEELLKTMNKKNDFQKVIKEFKNNIFWLTLSFFPGENIKTLRATGDFLRKYGSKPEQLYSRVAGNSTPGGLGQFFQMYPDTISKKELESQGILLTDRPIRLLPSFVPFSFLNDVVKEFRNTKEDEEFYYEFYKVRKIRDVIKEDIKKPISVLELCNYFGNIEEAVVSVAISAKLGVIS